VDSRKFTMNVFVGDPRPPYRRGAAWRELDGQFWQALSARHVSELVMEGQRSLRFRLDEGNDDLAFTEDPARLGKAVYPIACIAEEPYYRGKTGVTSFTFQDPGAEVNYYGGAAGLGPPYVISESSALRTASVPVPGDVEPWAIYRITGPAPSVSVGVIGHMIALPFAVQQDDTVTIDTERESITDRSGNDLWPLMGFASTEDFATLPLGDAVPVVIDMPDAGNGARVEVEVPSLYERAWGTGMDTAGEIIPPPEGSDDGALGTSPLGTSPLGGSA
jgi:hypothetical protein